MTRFFFLDCNPKIDDLDDIRVFFEEHVLGFEVSMHNAFLVEVDKCHEDLFHGPCGALFCELFGDDFLEELAAFAEFQYQDVVRLVVVDFVEFGDVGVVEGHHDGHLFEEFFVFGFFELGFLDSFGGAVEACVSCFDFVDTSETAATDFLEDGVVLKIVSFFHFNELIPLDFYFLNFTEVF